MAPRLNKRQQREQEELLSLASTKPPIPDQHESSEEEPVLHAKQAGFSALFTPEDETGIGQSEEEDKVRPTKSRKAKKKKKKATSTQDEAQVDHPSSVKPSTPSSAPSKSIPAKKAKGKAKKKSDGDDLEKALAELSMKYPDLQHVAAGSSSDSRTTTLSALLSVSVPHLDAESELRKFFGSKAVSAAQSSTASPSYKGRRGVQPQTQRSQLTRPQPSWGMTKQREGLSSRQLTEDEASRKASAGPAGGGKWWTVEYSKRYKGVTKTFMQAVMTGDPEALWSVLQRMPWHADTLLQLAEVYRHREEYSQAVEYVSRALYAYERAFLGAFSFTTGVNRLDFDRAENRPFFLALHRQVIDLQRRGCPRTAFEHARLLLSLEPLTDPHGVLFHLDYLAVKTGLGDWLEEVWRVYQGMGGKGMGECMDPSALPGWAYARALVMKAKEKEKRDRGEDVEEESAEALRQAITAFPSVVPLLADKCDISLSAEVRSHKAFRIRTDPSGLTPAESIIYLLSYLYTLRSFSLWKSSARGTWLATTAQAVLSTLSSQRANAMRDRCIHMFSSSTLQYSVYRHVFVLEQTHAQAQNRNLTAFVPHEITHGRHLACDPLPPPTAVSTYDSTFFAGVEDPVAASRRPRRRTQADERLLARLIPDAATRAQIVAFFDQNPWLAAQVPGGIVQFVQMMGEMPEDALEDLMMGAAMIQQAGGGAGAQPGLADRGMMPGEMPVEEEDVNGGDEDDPGQVHDDEDEDREEEEEEYVAPMPIRVISHLLSRFWGGGAQEVPENDRDQDGVD
ncbi:transcriptional repressor TCF25-domain-containing protein [Phlebopus sp. FC_14]|nr:transcriptional repressor TCF25-domain-containing protein [Phlebopus sp. FC_14]